MGAWSKSKTAEFTGTGYDTSVERASIAAISSSIVISPSTYRCAIAIIWRSTSDPSRWQRFKSARNIVSALSPKSVFF
jgi:hypothetical protein